jgi:hypothetical protein
MSPTHLQLPSAIISSRAKSREESLSGMALAIGLFELWPVSRPCHSPRPQVSTNTGDLRSNKWRGQETMPQPRSREENQAPLLQFAAI